MRLHVVGLAHTRTTSRFSHCAFTGKVRRFGMMLAPFGYECTHYGVGAPDSPGWYQNHEILTPSEQADLLGFDPERPGPDFVGNAADLGHPVYREFNTRLVARLAQYLPPEDLLCLPFNNFIPVHGREHQTVETGIGYPVARMPYRIYESSAWMHWHIRQENRPPWDSEWVIPNYFDPEEWPLRVTLPARSEVILYLGRLTPVKGLAEIHAMAVARPDLTFVFCGQGPPELAVGAPNVVYHPPVHGRERAALIHQARCVVCPTRYVEPFGGVAVEAMMTGTPVLASAHSAFLETVGEEFTCRMLSEWTDGFDRVCAVDPRALRADAIARFGLTAVGRRYDEAFQQIDAMRHKQWYA